MTSRYNAAAVDREIRRDRRIGAHEARLIHALLRGRDPEFPLTAQMPQTLNGRTIDNSHGNTPLGKPGKDKS